MASEFSLVSVKQYILDNGGRIRNHELVTHFKAFLNDPEHKATNREKFKDFVNELATIKVEEGEKVLVLKRKHRPESTISSSSSNSSTTTSNRSSVNSTTASTDYSSFQPPPAKSPYYPSSDDVSTMSDASSYGGSAHERERDFASPPSRAQYDYEGGSADSAAEAVRARSEPPERARGGGAGDGVDGMMMSKVYSDDNLDVRLKSSTRQNDGGGGGGPQGQSPKQSIDASTASLASSATGSQASLSSAAEGGGGVSGSGEEDGGGGGGGGNMSVLHRIQHLNKISSEGDLHKPNGGSAATPPRKKMVRDDDDESHSSGGASYVTLTQEQKQWMLTSSTADYHEMFRLLKDNPHLAKVKDIANGYTALHWAAKFGKPEVVKMLANKIGVNVNQRSNGGYTPLHLAAIHGHEDIIELLVSVYKADASIRDYSGKKAKQYLKNSASSRAQQLLVSTKMGSDFGSSRSLEDSFTRMGSARQSNRARAISSLIQATSSVMRQPVLRSSWDGPYLSDDDRGARTPGSTPPGSGSPSPVSHRKYKDEKNLMPPPHIPPHRRRRGEHSRSTSRDRINAQSRSTGAMDKDNKDDKENNNNNMPVARSESDPALTQKTFV